MSLHMFNRGHLRLPPPFARALSPENVRRRADIFLSRPSSDRDLSPDEARNLLNRRVRDAHAAAQERPWTDDWSTYGWNQSVPEALMAVPPPRFWGDFAAYFWKEICQVARVHPRSLRYVLQEEILQGADDYTTNPIQMALYRRDERLEYYAFGGQVVFSAEEEAGKALNGSLYGIETARMLIQNKETLGVKTITHVLVLPVEMGWDWIDYESDNGDWNDLWSQYFEDCADWPSFPLVNMVYVVDNLRKPPGQDDTVENTTQIESIPRPVATSM
ncbi:hypothetical protein EJ06DRAFT_553804 [Trichodelitschia bisporula]|uniref:Uncharacterized protein n=1 Tax=Trichodelitschia bisporula TaxID=703511 RepID=A0A6G1I5C7_9PEZI|nr:hypothetical protein EJ06DRAFT_553804 [Trichodelitschia bisporula]